MDRRVLIVGCGYVGERVGLAETAQVTAVVRSDRSAQALSRHSWSVLQLDLDSPPPTFPWPAADVIYYLAPPPGAGDVDPRLQWFLKSLETRPAPQRLVLISTTGVYGDCGGAWIDEQRPPAPRVARARRRLAAEQTLRAWADARDTPWVILRVPGIYGPFRVPLQRLQSGEPLLRIQDAPYSNRIHVDDLVRCCLAAAHHPAAQGLYNVADGRPSTMTEYFHQVADVFGLPRSPEIDLQEAKSRLSAGMLSYLAESKRIEPRRVREELGVEMIYEDLEKGLRQSREAMQQSTLATQGH